MMWKEKYKVGVELIDEQHKELFQRVSHFTQTIRSEEDWEKKLDKVKETMDFMKDYVVVHFNEEEAYQEKINYPDIEEHKKAHASFKEGVNNYVKILKQRVLQKKRSKNLEANL